MKFLELPSPAVVFVDVGLAKETYQLTTINRDLVAASATPLLLALLETEESYGYRIIRRVRESSSGEIEWTEGMLYPVLHRLEKRGMISSQWKVSDQGRRRKYYALTEMGHAELERQRGEWRTVHSTLQRLGFMELERKG